MYQTGDAGPGNIERKMLSNMIIDEKKNRELFPNIELNNGKVDVFTSFSEEYEALNYGAGVRIIDANVLLMSGKDVKDFLHRVSTNDINSVEENHYTNTLFTNEKGRIIDSTLFLNLGEHFYLVGHRNELKLLDKWIDRYIISEDVKIDNVSDRKLFMEVIGPQAESFLTLFCGSCIDSISDNNIIDIEIDDIKAKLIKTTSSKNSRANFIMMFDKDFQYNVIEKFCNQPSVFDFAMVGEKAYHTYRVEKGIPAYPNELNDSYNPHEADVIHHVSETKGCYIGQEVIARLDTYDKVQRELKHFHFMSEFDFNGNSHAIKDVSGNSIGAITTIVNSPKYKRLLGLGYVKKKELQKLTNGSVNINGTDVNFELKDFGRSS
jgi:folate-binding protein YgfZ